ncbi:hypothetical protein [Pseudomonas umsongensis]|uniref:hypothetical protein n=1 Tax=Pseudomonas umsongensis TaxID=198618 RepID=UPI003D7F3C30
MKFYRKDLRCKIIFIFAFVIGLVTFQGNVLRAVDNGFFSSLDRFSQILVTGRIIAYDAGVDSQGWNLGSVKVNDVLEYTEDNLNTYNKLHQKDEVRSVVYFPYQSQYGIQGAFFLGLHKLFGIKTPGGLQFVNAALFSVVIALLSVLFVRVYDWKFALVFFFVMITSPWVVSFARNLYWVPFLWFLPTVFSSMLYLNRDAATSKKWILSIGVLASIFLKSLAGYEYLSAITIFACAPFVVGPFFRSEKKDYIYNIRMAVWVGLLCVLGFMCAIIIHAGMRGDSVLDGIANIIEQDVKKRTYGDPAGFDPILRASLTASVADVLGIYWWKWATPLFAGISAIFLNVGVAFVLAGACYSLAKRRVSDAKVFALVVITLLCPLSWFVLAKGHSFVHVQLNYVLWYFGFIQALTYAAIILVPAMFADGYRLLKRGSFIDKAIMAALACAIFSLVWVLHVKQKDIEHEQFLALSVDSFEVGSGVKVFLFQNNEMAIIKEKCDAADFTKMFFVHAFPESAEGKKGIVEGMLNLDFKVDSGNKNNTFLSKYYGSCKAVLKLPNFGLAKIAIGQYTLPDVKVAWQGSINLSSKRYVASVVPFDLTDANWMAGVSTFDSGFFVENNFLNRQSLKVGDELLFNSSGKKRVTRIDYSDQFINVFLVGEILTPKLDGYPNNVIISAP